MLRLSHALLAVATLVATACSDPESTPAADSSSGSGDTAAAATDETGASTTAAGESTAAGSGDTGVDPDSTSGDPMAGSSTGQAIQPCGLEDLKPGARNPLVGGMGAMELPPDIADVLVAGCGCHLADDHTVPDVPDYPATGAFDLSTHAGFQALRAGDDMPYHQVARGYVETDFMPLNTFCHVGDGNAMDPDDRALLLSWLDAGAPDGATWVP